MQYYRKKTKTFINGNKYKNDINLEKLKLK